MGVTLSTLDRILKVMRKMVREDDSVVFDGSAGTCEGSEDFDVGDENFRIVRGRVSP